MKNFLALYLFQFFLLSHLRATNCDSVVIQVTPTFSIYTGWSKNITSFTYNDGLLRKKIAANVVTEYYYDSLRRKTEVINILADSTRSWTDYFYSSAGNDSAQVVFRFDGQNSFISYGYFFVFDINNNLQTIYDEKYDTLTMLWDTTAVENYYYSSDSLTRYDTIFSYPGNYESFEGFIVWDSLGRVISNSGHGGFYWSSSSYEYDTICPYGIIRSIGNNVTGGPGGYTTTTYAYWTYDSICRPLKVVDSTWTFQYPYANSQNISETDFYYTDCNNIFLAGLDTIVTCPGMPATLGVQAVGGTGSLSYHWISIDSLSDDSVSNPQLFTDSGAVCILTVTDSLGQQAQFQQLVAVNQFHAIVTDATCDTCDDGIIELVYPQPQPYYYISSLPHAGTLSGTTINNVLPGVYNVCSQNGTCTYCDSVHVNSTTPVIDKGFENIIYAYPNPAGKNLYVKVPVSQQKVINWILRSIEGKIIKSNREQSPEFNIPVEDLEQGLYFLEVVSGFHKTIRVMKD